MEKGRTNPKGKLTDRIFSLVFRLGGTFPLTQCIGQGSDGQFQGGGSKKAISSGFPPFRFFGLGCPTNLNSVFQRSLSLACLRFFLSWCLGSPPLRPRLGPSCLAWHAPFARLPLCTVGFTCWVGWWSVAPSDFGGGPTKVVLTSGWNKRVVSF